MRSHRQPLVAAPGTSSDPSAHPALPVVPPQPAHSSSRQASWPCRRRGCPTSSRRRRPSRSPRAGPSCAGCCPLRRTSLAGYTRTCALRPRSVWRGHISQREARGPTWRAATRHEGRRSRRAAATPGPARGRRALLGVAGLGVSVGTATDRALTCRQCAPQTSGHNRRR